MKTVRVVAAAAAFGVALTACSSSSTSTSCGRTGITAQVRGNSSVGLLSCSGLADITPLPAFTVPIGKTVKVTGHGLDFTSLAATGSTDVVGIDGTTITARSSGRATIVVSGVACVADKAGHQPTTCPLLTVTVP